MMLPEKGRWVLLLHDVPRSDSELGQRGTHWDLMLEDQDFLWTWALPQLPPGLIEAAQRLPNHRSLYLEYEGELSNGRGSVSKVASGEYQRLKGEPTYDFRLIVDWPEKKMVVRFQQTDNDYWRIDWSSAGSPSAI